MTLTLGHGTNLRSLLTTVWVRRQSNSDDQHWLLEDVGQSWYKYRYGADGIGWHYHLLTDTIRPLQRAVQSDEADGRGKLSLVIPLVLMTVLFLVAAVVFLYLIKKRNQKLQYKSKLLATIAFWQYVSCVLEPVSPWPLSSPPAERSKSHNSMFSDISDIDPHHAARQNFSMPRENVSADSKVWLLNQQAFNHRSETAETLRVEGQSVTVSVGWVLHTPNQLIHN